MKNPASLLVSELSSAWSCSDFGAPELKDYAAPVITQETRRGVALLSVAVLIMLVRGPDVAALAVRLEATLPGVAPTVSLGLVGLPARGCPSFDQAYKLADELLYQARHAGGNAIRCGQAAGVHA
jgi:GGDEF domain-containing protein